MSALPNPEEFASLVAAWPDIPDWTQYLTVSADKAAEMIGIQPGSIRIPRDAPGGRWLLATLIRWRASLPGRGHGAGRPPADTTALVAALRERVAETEGRRLTVLLVSELLDVSPRIARRVYVEFTGEEPLVGRLPGN
jgi:hypothetical protein